MNRSPSWSPTWGSPRVLAIVGSVCFLAAMITAGANVPEGKSFWLIFGSVVLIIYEVLVHTGTGVVAVAVSARICEQKFGNFELGVSRVYAAFAAFEMVYQLSLRILARRQMGRVHPGPRRVLAGDLGPVPQESHHHHAHGALPCRALASSSSSACSSRRWSRAVSPLR